MKTFQLSVLLLVSVGWASAELVCPEVDEGETYLPSDTNCQEYFHCVHGVPVMRKCPDGLQWDATNQFCNWPDQISPPCTGIMHRFEIWNPEVLDFYLVFFMT